MRQKRKSVPLPVLLVLLSFLAPSELSLYLADLRLPPHRVALLLVFPFAALRLFSSRGTRVRAFDVFFLLFNAWTVLAFSLHGSSNGGIVFGGSLALESFGAYSVARAYIRDMPTFRASLQMFTATVLIACMFSLPETLLGKYFVHDVLRPIFGGHQYLVESRLGLTRALAMFDHPIHLGTYCAGLLALVWYTERRSNKRIRTVAIMSVATLTALSTAPLLCAAVQIGLTVVERITRGLKDRTLIAGILLAGLYIGVSLIATRSPITIIATRLTLDSWTGYYRTFIWEYGINNVLAHPLIGIGLADWERPAWMVSSTVDAVWLVIAMRTGIPAILLLTLAILFLARAVSKATKNRKDLQLRRIATGWLISMTALILVGITVHYWNVLYTFFFFFLGLGGWMADPKRKKIQRPAQTRWATVPPPPARYTGTIPATV